MSLFNSPSIIVLQAPGTRAGKLRYPCLLCEQSFPIQRSTLTTIEDLKRRKMLYIVVCYQCLPSISQKTRRGMPITGVREARAILGIDKKHE